MLKSQSALDEKLLTIKRRLDRAGMTLSITCKPVKNINFRVKSGQLKVSHHRRVSQKLLLDGIEARIDWAIKAHHRQQEHDKKVGSNINAVDSGNFVLLWGERFALTDDHAPSVNRKPDVYTIDWDNRLIWLQALGSANTGDKKIQDSRSQLDLLYRDQLQSSVKPLVEHWQDIIGKKPKHVRLKRMTTRWGSCNAHAKRIWLSIFLAKYPIRCLEYVIVHELCHLHEANHSPRFWGHVAQAMPDYQDWQNILRHDNFQWLDQS